MIIHIFPQSGFIFSFMDLLQLDGDSDRVSDDHIFVFAVNGSHSMCHGLPDLQTEFQGHNHIYSIGYTVPGLPFRFSKTIFSTKLFHLLRNADLIIFHSFPAIINVSLLFPTVLRKSVWVIWGHDIADYKPGNSTFLSRAYFHLHYPFKKFIASQIPHVVSRPSEYSVILGYYNYKATNHLVPALYPPIFELNSLIPSKSHSNTVGVLLGHSAFKDEGHLSILKSLSSFSGESIHIYLPLAYGNAEYASIVSEEAFKQYGVENVTVLTKPIPYDDYCAFILNCIDVAILDSPQQSGLGNIFLLLSLGKKVFLNDDGLNKSICDDVGFHTFNSSTLHHSSITLDGVIEMDDNVVKQNMSLAMEYMDPHVAKKQWDDVFKLAEKQ